MSDISNKTSGFGIGELGQVPEGTTESLLVALSAQPKPQRKPDFPNGKRLSCGHTVYHWSEVMNASRGTSCPSCFDRMSD